MLFNSIEFASFFAVVLAIYWMLYEWVMVRNAILLVASIYFYGRFHYTFPIYLLFLISVAYFSGLLISNQHDKAKKSGLLAAGICLLSFGLLYIKYSGLILSGIPGLSGWQSSALHILVPLGISYYTFSSIGYITDVYRGDIAPEKNFITYAAYISFFPHILSGPIPSAITVLPQFKVNQKLTLDRINQSIGEILWGLFKKMVVSDNIASAVSYCFKQNQDLNGSTLFLGAILFTIQVYADFSGYSDIAKGLAGLLGIEITQNFHHPFSSKSVTEFWRRWHISLTTWFYTYIFNPMVDSLRFLGNPSIIIALVVTFCLSGLWHGASWTYIIYGFVNSMVLVYEFFTRKQRKKMFKKIPLRLNHLLSNLLTMIFICFLLIFFRANTISDAFSIFSHVLSPGIFTVPASYILKYFLWTIPLIVVEWIQKDGNYTMDMAQWSLSDKKPWNIISEPVKKKMALGIKVIIYTLLVVAIMVFSKKQNMAEYYYFKF